MPYLITAQSWLEQSTLLLQARPSTTRITTKYTIKPPPSSLPPKPRSKPPNSKPSTTSSSEPGTDTAAPTPAPEPIRATLILKTYDPVSGTTLKYSTTKAAEVSRLVQILGRLARPMAGLPEVKEDVNMVDAAGMEEKVLVPVAETKSAQGGAAGAGGGGGGKKKGKKGKR